MTQLEARAIALREKCHSRPGAQTPGQTQLVAFGDALLAVSESRVVMGRFGQSRMLQSPGFPP